MSIVDGEDYGKDMGILWAAHKAGTFGLGEVAQEDFADVMLEVLSKYDSAWMVEDRNDVFPSKRGPIATILVKSDGFVIKPDVDYFKWASHRNVLRTTVAFFNWVRYSKDVSLCVFGSTPESKNLYWKMRDYGIMVTYVGNGMFALAGEKPCQAR
jgi:hypothetical protein